MTRGASILWLLLIGAAFGAGCSGRALVASSGTSGTGGTGGTGSTSTTTTTTTTTSASGAGGAAGSTSSSGGTGGGLAQGRCRKDTDCKVGFELCLAPGAFAGCGTCAVPPMTCASDAECKVQGATFICASFECSCGAKSCVAGCTADPMCGVGEACSATNHCEPKPCGSATDCPVDFACGAAGCERQACSSDASCKAYCVDGACYQALGTCTPLPE